MKKRIFTLIAFLLLGMADISFAVEEPAKSEQKPAEKIIITEEIKPDPEEKAAAQEAPAKKEEPAKQEAPKESQVKEEAPKEAVSTTSKPKEASKSQEVDMEKVEKVVDDLVKKLDENSNLKKALVDVKTNIKSSDKDKKQTPEVTKKTEAVIKDYSQKITEAKSESQKKQLEEEAAHIIRNISDSSDSSSSNEESKDDEDADKDKKDDENLKKDKLVIEVKSDEKEESDEEKIYALREDEERSESNHLISTPVLVVGIILLSAILVVLGIVIKKRDI